MHDNHSDILERLAHPEKENEPKKMPRRLFLRNILNTLFILLALATIIGISLHFNEEPKPTWCYAAGILAVLIKMCESLLRMPGLNKSAGIPTHRRGQR